MPLNIKNAEADRVARELADLTGETITDAVIVAIKERLRRERLRRTYGSTRADMRRIRERYRNLPPLDERPADEIIGYDDSGLPR